MGDSRYVVFDDIFATAKELYAYTLHKCEAGNQEDAIKLANEIRDCQKNLLNRFEQSPNLSNPIDQLVKYADIKNACSPTELHYCPLDNESFLNKLAGAVIGRLAGCILGVPVENWHPEDIYSMAEQFGDDFPPRDYWTKVYYPDRSFHHGFAQRKDYSKEFMKCAPPDDDIGYTILDLLVIEKYGFDFTTEDIASVWMEKLPFAHSAEKIALANIHKHLPTDQVASVHNPYVEWIGGCIRSDGWAWICAGYPDKAAEFAWRDAYLTHRQNGMYGEMFFAAVEAAAFVESSFEKIIEIGLSVIPYNCSLSQDVRWAVENKDFVHTWQDAVRLVNKRFAGMSRVHTRNNACLVIFGLFLGEKDFDKTIGNIIAMGYDNDCNAATVGSILGAIIGLSGIDEKWYKPFNGQLSSYITGEEHICIEDFIKRYYEQSEKFRQSI